MTPSHAVGAAQKVELFGFDFVWVSESVGFDALPILGAIATKTRKIGLGTGVANVFSRSPTQVAMAAATIEQLSPGRFILGMGASTANVVENWHHLEYEGALKRVESYADAVSLKLRKERRELPAPFSSLRRDIPMYLAGVGEGMVSLAKKKADGVLFFLRPATDVDAKCRQLASATFDVSANVVTCVSSNREAAERKARRTVAFYLTYGSSYRRLVQQLAPSEAVGEAVAGVRDDWLKGRKDDAASRIPEEVLDEVAIYGKPSDCRRALEKYSRIGGLHMLGLQFNPGERSLAASLDLLSSFPEYV